MSNAQDLADDLSDAQEFWTRISRLGDRSVAWWTDPRKLVSPDLRRLAHDVVDSNREHSDMLRKADNNHWELEDFFAGSVRYAEAALLLAPWHPVALWVAGTQPNLDHGLIHHVVLDLLAERWDEDVATRPIAATQELLWQTVVALTGPAHRSDERTAEVLMLVLMSGSRRAGGQAVDLAAGYLDYWWERFDKLPFVYMPSSKEEIALSGELLSAVPQSLTRSGERDTRAVREWARRNGIQVSDRGRLSRDLLNAYDEAYLA